MTGLIEDPTFWVGVSLALFLLIVVWQRVPQMIARALDDRAAAIKSQLDEAKRLREEAETLLKEYRAKTANVSEEVQGIIDQAKAAAERAADEARVQLQQQIERRAKMAEEKIAQAEAEALADVRAAAASTSSAAAAIVIGKQLDGSKGDGVVDSAIRDLRTKLH
jgi:F-type H+-transporting ATPase subunit b